MIPDEHSTLIWPTRREDAGVNPTRRGTEEVESDVQLAMRVVQRIQCNSLVLLCRFWMSRI
jgi:hypothetical protein